MRGGCLLAGWLVGWLAGFVGERSSDSSGHSLVDNMKGVLCWNGVAVVIAVLFGIGNVHIVSLSRHRDLSTHVLLLHCYHYQYCYLSRSLLQHLIPRRYLVLSMSIRIACVSPPLVTTGASAVQQAIRSSRTCIRSLLAYWQYFRQI